MKKLLLVFTGLLIASLSYSQGLVHVKGQNALDLRYFHAGNGKAYELGYARFLRDDFVFKSGLNYEKGKIGLTEYSDISLKLTPEYTLYTMFSKIFFNASLPIVGTIQNTINPEYISSVPYFIYGFGIGGEIEYYPISNFALVIEAYELFTNNNKFGKFHYQIGGGLRINF
ncbi:MAG: hypothetical protein ACK4ON_00015 [Bacteroidia bacterium]